MLHRSKDITPKYSHSASPNMFKCQMLFMFLLKARDVDFTWIWVIFKAGCLVFRNLLGFVDMLLFAIICYYCFLIIRFFLYLLFVCENAKCLSVISVPAEADNPQKVLKRFQNNKNVCAVHMVLMGISTWLMFPQWLSSGFCLFLYIFL